MEIESIRANLDREGFAIFKSIADVETLGVLVRAVEDIDAGHGVRNVLSRVPCISQFAASSTILDLMRQLIGPSAICVRAILFDKNPQANWKVAWHQDTTIAIKQRIDLPGFGPWSVKEGVPHVRPPAEILANMLTLRLHLDDCDHDNGPLRVIAGSHLHGILDDNAIAQWKQKSPEICICNAGDALLMKPLILHASSQATRPAHRRVIHLEFAAGELPGGLQWAV